MKEYGEEEIQIQRFLTSALHERLVSFISRKDPTVPNEKETGLVPDPVWAFSEDKRFSEVLAM
jgi:hypothetical protein